MRPVYLALSLVVSVTLALFLLQNKNFNKLTLPSPTPTPLPSTNHVSTSQGPISNIPFKLPPGFTIHVFAADLSTPRVLAFSPGGTLLVSNPNANLVIALPDQNHDGVADSNKIIISRGDHIHGLAFYNNQLFVAEVNKVNRYNWDEQNLTATFDKTLFDLPENNDHNLRTLTFDNQGNLYISVGSTCNVCNEIDPRSGTIMVSNFNGDNPKIFAQGLRNAPFTVINPKTGELWATEMGRDYLGDNQPPDEINIIKSGQNYGWPDCFGDGVPDFYFNPSANNTICQNTQTPIFQIPAHNAPLGLVFINSTQFPNAWQGDLLISLHGSWNSSTKVGYKVVHLKVNGNKITHMEDFLTGFLQSGESLGRPVDLIFDQKGNLYLSDDKSGNIYIIQKQ